MAFRHLAWNLEPNAVNNVSAFSVALSQGVGLARMASFGGEAGDSMTSLLNDGEHGSDVITLGWEDFASSADLSRVSLVKMDIEGAEFDVLPSLLPWLKEHRPALYLSTHAPFLDSETGKQRIQELADSLSFYNTYLQHLPRGQWPGLWLWHPHARARTDPISNLFVQRLISASGGAPMSRREKRHLGSRSISHVAWIKQCLGQNRPLSVPDAA